MRSLLFLALLGVSVAHVPKFFHGKPAGGFVDGGARRVHLAKYGEELNRDVWPNLLQTTFTQKITHFNDTIPGTFQQRYWYNWNYVPTNGTKSNNVFLMIQGESPATPRWAAYEGYQYLQMAKVHSAHVFQLEHRCFGYSRPKNDLSYSTLQLCTIEEALEDIAAFIDGMNALYNFTSPKWITFGGSYPGILSALFRANYPSYTVGAVASSAPLRFTFDLWEYAVSMEQTLRTIPNCAESVQAAFTKMQQLSLSKEGRDTLNTKLNLSPGFDANTKQIDIDNFFETVFASFQDIIQYTKDGRNNATMNGRDINTLCSYMNDNSRDPLDNVMSVVLFATGVSSIPNSYADLMTALQNTTFDDENPDLDAATNRGWLWLQCAQLGVQQTTDQGSNIFGQTVPINYFLYMCRDGFGIAAGMQHAQTTAYRKKYGTAFKATNIVLPNGSFDPWHMTGIPESATDNANNFYPLLIDGGAHCSDMYEQYSGEPTDLAAKRNAIAGYVDKFLHM